jgi:formyl-CoA transferase
MMLADLGARVIKIEQPRGGDDTRHWGPPFLGTESAYFLSINRNKESVTLDFKHARGRALLDQLIAMSDVVVENFRPGTLARLGLDYATLAPKYPRLIHCSVSGYGHTGPRSQEPGYDAVLQGEGGLMSLTGAPDVPPVRVGVAVADIVTGIFACQGISAALYARERTGRGQQVDIAMLDTVAAMPYETFTASDGEFVLAVGTDEQWRKFCEVAALDAGDRFATNRERVTGYAELRPVIAARVHTQTRSYWIERLGQAGVPCGSVRDLHEVFTDPQIAARSMVVPMSHPTAGDIRVLGSPLKLSDTPATQRTPPPTLGQHTESVLQRDLGLTRDAIDELRAGGVI